MSTMTKERAAQIAAGGGFNFDEIAVLARIALASLEAEAVAYADAEELRFPHATSDMWRSPLGHGWDLPLYTAPPAPVSLPDESAVELLATDLMKRIDKITGERHSVATLSSLRVSIVEACRAAMFQGAEPVTTANKLPFEQWLSQQTGTIDVECGCVMTEVFFHWLRVAYEAGNYPVIPDGWVLVPIEPTYQMCEAMGLQWESPRFPDRYKAMLGAVKK
ncbi:hypothetical protein [Enterobacter kobei]|uniref:hypothetical protein n=1 Tax=Enterobacter kobei TaxID=208224 RepID=UPI0032AFAEE1